MSQNGIFVLFHDQDILRSSFIAEQHKISGALWLLVWPFVKAVLKACSLKQLIKMTVGQKCLPAGIILHTL